jgi:hypothetical protein
MAPFFPISWWKIPNKIIKLFVIKTKMYFYLFQGAQMVLIALFNLNPPEFSMMLSYLPKAFQVSYFILFIVFLTPLSAIFQLYLSLHLAEEFQRRRLKCEKLTDDRRQVMAKAHVAFGKVNLVGYILGRSSIKIAHLVPICLQTWPPQTILVCDWLISKKSSPLKPLCQMNRNLVGSILK